MGFLILRASTFLGLAALLAPVSYSAAFDLEVHSIPPDEIFNGGPPKDGIPAILAPKFIPASEARWLHPADRVVGLEVEGIARAYPHRILAWHEIVNDRLATQALAITYCPLTGSAVVFDRTVSGVPFEFGVSGRLYRSNLLMYDHESESLWSQLAGAAVTGARTGTTLKTVPATVTTWAAWRGRHPDTEVLSMDTGTARDYDADPYAGYEATPDLAFPVGSVDDRLPPKARVVGVAIEGAVVAFPIDLLQRRRHVVYSVGARVLRAESNLPGDGITVATADGRERVHSIEAFWFAWAAFHPNTALVPPLSAGAASPAPPSDPPGNAISSRAIQVIEHSAYWADLPGLPTADADPHGATLLVVSGSLRNRSRLPVHHVRLRFELLDKSGTVVAAEEGFSRSGEQLKPVSGVDEPSHPTPPLPPQATDRFRMLFVRADLPAFERYVVHVVDSPGLSPTSAGHRGAARRWPAPMRPNP